MPHNAAGYFYPSYLDTFQEGDKNNFQELADSLPRVGPILVQGVEAGEIPLAIGSMDVMYVLAGESSVLITSDERSGIPDGAQVAVTNASTKDCLIKTSPGVTLINGDDKFVIPPQKVGNLVKLNANFWLLSLGTGSGGSYPDGVPDAPVIAFASDRLSITWTAPESPTPILNYAANVTPEGCKWHITGTTLFIDTPLPNVDHTFEVYAVNERGNGPLSNLLATAYTPPSIPTIKSVTAGPGSFTMTWDLLDGASDFIVEWRKVGDTTWSEKNFDSPADKGTVSGLLGDTDYEVRLVASNIAGRSQPTASQTIKTQPAFTDKPQIAHSGHGQYTITNYNATYLYTVANGLGSVTDNIVTINNGNTVFQVDSQFNALGPIMSVTGEVRQYQFHPENFPYPCGTHECNCRTDWASCGCGDCSGYPSPNAQSFGQCGCGATMCWYNQQTVCDQCTSYCDDYKDVKNPTPDGFTDAYGEWSRVDG